MGFILNDGQTFLFAGDTITDCGCRSNYAPLGNGYANLFAGLVLSEYPGLHIKFINQGSTSGDNTTVDLRNRWNDDVLRHKPDWISILTGIYDIHLLLNTGNKAFTPEKYRANLECLISSAQAEMDCRIILIEPFLMSIASEDDGFRGSVLGILHEYHQEIENLSRQYGAIVLPMHQIFQRLLKDRETEIIGAEAVHPNITGHQVMALSLFNLLHSNI